MGIKMNIQLSDTLWIHDMFAMYALPRIKWLKTNECFLVFAATATGAYKAAYINKYAEHIHGIHASVWKMTTTMGKKRKQWHKDKEWILCVDLDCTDTLRIANEKKKEKKSSSKKTRAHQHTNTRSFLKHIETKRWVKKEMYCVQREGKRNSNSAKIERREKTEERASE